jgi:hypothetical protein
MHKVPQAAGFKCRLFVNIFIARHGRKMFSAACREHKQATGRRRKKVIENSWKFYVDAKSHVGGKKQKKVLARRRR